jgi:hypothetical protein
MKPVATGCGVRIAHPLASLGCLLAAAWLPWAAAAAAPAAQDAPVDENKGSLLIECALDEKGRTRSSRT